MMPELQLFPYYPDQLISYELNIKGQEREREKKKKTKMKIDVGQGG